MALGFLVPSGIARAVILMPIVVALAKRLEFGPRDRGCTGVVVTTTMCGCVIPATIFAGDGRIEPLPAALWVSRVTA